MLHKFIKCQHKVWYSQSLNKLTINNYKVLLSKNKKCLMSLYFPLNAFLSTIKIFFPEVITTNLGVFISILCMWLG